MTQKPDNPPAMMTNEQLAEAVRHIGTLNDGNLGKINYDIIAQQDAIIQQQRDEIEALQAVVFEPCCATEQTIQQQRDVMRMAREALVGWELRNGGLHIRSDDGRKAIAALDAALKGSE